MFRSSHTRNSLVALIAAAALTACSGATETPGSPDSPGGAVPGDTTVAWWGWAPGTELAEEYIAAFNEDHPDITVEYRSIPFGDYVNALRLGVQSDTGPDVFNLQPGEITNRFATFADDLTPLLDDELGDDWQSQLVGDSALQFAADDKQAGLPVQLSASGFLWYNQTALQEAGVDESPANWDEFLAACETVNASGKECFMIGAQDAWLNTDVYMTLAQDIAPGKFYEAVEGEAEWTDPGLVEAFAKWQEMFTAEVAQEGAVGLSTYPDVQTQFTVGEGVFIPLGTWSVGELMTRDGLQLAQQREELLEQIILPMPFPDVNGDGQSPAPFGGPDYGLAIASNSTAKEAAWTFLSWLTVQEGQDIIASKKFVPSLASASIDDAGLVDDSQQSDAIQEMSSILDSIAGPREIPYGELKVAIGDALSSLAVGQQTPEDAAASVQAVSETVER